MKNAVRDNLLKDKQILLSLVTVLFRLEFIQNLEKSDLIPSQQFVHLGFSFDTGVLFRFPGKEWTSF